MLKENAILEEFDSKIKSLSKDDSIALVHDLDADGICSGTLVYLAIIKITGKEPLVITQKHKTIELLPKTIELLAEKKISKLFIVDMACDQKKDALAKAEEICNEIVILDHHKDYGYSSEKSFVVKAQFISGIEPSTYPASKLVFDIPASSSLFYLDGRGFEKKPTFL